MTLLRQSRDCWPSMAPPGNLEFTKMQNLLESKNKKELNLALSWRGPLSYRNPSIDLPSKLMDWFLYDNGFGHERVKRNSDKTVYNGTETLTFLGPRIWKIVRDYIKNVTALRNLNWKQSYGIQKIVHAGYAKGSYHKLVLHNASFNLLCSMFYHFCVTFLFYF